jgi:hypothetical protein
MIVTGFDERLDRETLRDVVSSAWGGISYTYELKPSRKELGRRPCFFCPNTNPNHESPSCFRVAITEILPGKMVLNGQEVIFETYCV